MKTRITPASASLVGLTLGWLAIAGVRVSVVAGGIVTGCDPASLSSALATGGTVTFECSGTLAIPSTLVITRDTVIDGTGQSVILDGEGKTRLFEVRDGARLVLRDLALIRGLHEAPLDAATPALAEGGGGAVSVTQGTLEAFRVVFRDHLVVGGIRKDTSASGVGGPGHGGAVRVRQGQAEFEDCTFSGNRSVGGPRVAVLSTVIRGYGAARGGAILGTELATLRLTRCQFLTNTATGAGTTLSPPGGAGGDAFGGAVFFAGPRLEARDCRFVGNAATAGPAARSYPGGQSGGGAISLSQNVTNAVIVGTRFDGNACNAGESISFASMAPGGAVWNEGRLRIDAATFRDNRALSTVGPARGGAIFNKGFLEATRCGFEENAARAGSGGGPNTLPGHPSEGGAVCVETNTQAILSECSFVGNVAQGGTGGPLGLQASPGGPGRGGAVCAKGPVSLRNGTFVRNEARGGNVWVDWLNAGAAQGGAIWVGPGPLAARHLTLSANLAKGGAPPIAGGANGGGASGGGVFATVGASVDLAQSILDSHPEGGGCSGAFTASANNLGSDGTCGFAPTGGWDQTPARLGPLQVDAAGLPYLPLLADSPAIDRATPASCPATDQRGAPRPAGAGCDLGAIERTILEATMTQAGALQVRFVGPPDTECSLEGTPAPGGAELKWAPVATARTDAMGTVTFHPIRPASATSVFYRVRY